MRELFDEVAGKSPLDPQEAVRREARVPKRKRFYKEAGVTEADGGFAVTLDGKPIKTPSGRIVAVPVRAIADAIAAEWERAEGDDRSPDHAADALCQQRRRVGGRSGRSSCATTSRNISTPICCSIAPVIRRRWSSGRRAHWDPVLFWAADALGAHFILGEGIMHVRQPDTAVEAARAALPDDPWSVAAVHVVTTLTGSALLALALTLGARDPDQVWDAAHVDEDWNGDQWGVDEEVAARRAAREVDFRAAVADFARAEACRLTRG